jgi:hypothetical protein
MKDSHMKWRYLLDMFVPFAIHQLFFSCIRKLNINIKSDLREDYT